MNLYIVENEQEGGKLGYNLLKEAMDQGNIKVLGLATGSTPITFYEEIVKSDLDFSEMTSVNLDEYYGIDPNHEQSYKSFMEQYLFSKKPFKVSYIPNSLELDAEKECARYDEVLKENPVDIQILGIGRNGHIGFNEPGSSFETRTQKVALTQSTIEANSRFFDSIDEVPKYAYSMGIQSIMESKRIILFAYGKNKSEAIKQLVEGEVSNACTATILQTHPNVDVIVDKEAASLLER